MMIGMVIMMRVTLDDDDKQWQMILPKKIPPLHHSNHPSLHHQPTHPYPCPSIHRIAHLAQRGGEVVVVGRLFRVTLHGVFVLLYRVAPLLRVVMHEKGVRFVVVVVRVRVERRGVRLNEEWVKDFGSTTKRLLQFLFLADNNDN